MRAKFFLKFWCSCGIAGLAVVLSGCDTVPITGRSQLNLMSSGREAELGLTGFNQLKKEIPISKNTAANLLVQKVGRRIASMGAWLTG